MPSVAIAASNPPGRLVIYGAGGMAREMVFAAREDGRELAFLSDAPAERYRDDIPVLSHGDLRDTDEIVISCAAPATRERLSARAAFNTPASLIAPTALIDPTAAIGEGAVICDHVMINARARIGRFFQCNYYSHVSHDCVVGDFVTLSPRVSCCGTVHIHDGVFVGAGAVIRNGLNDRPLVIGEGATIGMGAVVVADVAPDGD
jgi:sugar O-acyltransferase (sialic acid O-acetyltransferase NeuD family)